MLVAYVGEILSKHPRIDSLLHNISTSTLWQSLPEEARPLLVATYFLKHPQKILIVTSNYEKALQWQAKLLLCGIPETQIKQLPSGISALFEDASPETTTLSERLGALYSLLDPLPSIVITTPQSALERTLPREVFEQTLLHLKVEHETSPEAIIKVLVELGYEPADPVRVPGQFCKRGGLLDIYAFGRNAPVRIEFFGDEIESLREFDPSTQRSQQYVLEVFITPARETLPRS